MWETASMCVLLGRKSNKATAVFAVLPKFYQHTYLIKCPPLGGHLFQYCSISLKKMVLHQNNIWNANVGNSVNVCVIGRRKPYCNCSVSCPLQIL